MYDHILSLVLNVVFILLELIDCAYFKLILIFSFFTCSDMEGSALLMCCYGSINAAVRIEDTMGYDEVLQKICVKLDDLRPTTMSLTYSLPRYPNIKLENSDDLSNLFFFISTNNIGRVARVVVNDCSPMHLDNDCCGTLSMISESVGMVLDDDDGDLLPTFYRQPEKVLL